MKKWPSNNVLPESVRIRNFSFLFFFYSIINQKHLETKYCNHQALHIVAWKKTILEKFTKLKILKEKRRVNSNEVNNNNNDNNNNKNSKE